MTETTKVVTAIEDLPTLIGKEFGPSSWREISQGDVNVFAEVSGDHNPIHLDQQFAETTPFGGTIAHGLLTLSLVVPLMAEVFEVTGVGMGINYGLNKVRFPAPVPVGSRIRISGNISSVTEVPGGWQIEVPVTFEIENAPKPACVAEFVLRYYK